MRCTTTRRRALLPVLTVAAALAVGSALAADAANVADDPALEARVNAVSAELRCLVCQNQSLADSHAGLAIDLKNQVRDQLKAGRTAPQVIDYMTARYGDFVRYRPPWKASTVLLWAGPFMLVLGGLFGLWRALARQQAAQAGLPELDDADADAAARLLAPAADSTPST
ncbi:MAG: cytochrome c-type biogenesis protein CcmH [Aquabacterium sp.]|nr:cytochrome c-type biogenesis protein CcmH [Aquabacterium sp.]